MTYREKQREKAVALRDLIFKDPGQGLFSGKPREFVLNDPSINLWEGIREDAKEYFRKHSISWWRGTNNEPTGHLLSSQIACINHLYFIRQREDVATSLLKYIDQRIHKAILVDDGFVEFEFIGQKQYLSEKAWTRGANCTSLDAVMIGVREDNVRVYFLIEWKYTESYSTENKYIPERSKVYDNLITGIHSPFNKIDVDSLYYEPFYQMMRQTLLAEAFIANTDHGCSDYYHVHIIPKENVELLNDITSPKLKGNNISDAWKMLLKTPQRYMSYSPDNFLEPIKNCNDCKSIIHYLENRYWH